MIPESDYVVRLYQAERDTNAYAAIVADIWRKAREGMVDADDIIILTATLEDFIRQYGQHIEALRAKHPNLFTK